MLRHLGQPLSISCLLGKPRSFESKCLKIGHGLLTNWSSAFPYLACGRGPVTYPSNLAVGACILSRRGVETMHTRNYSMPRGNVPYQVLAVGATPVSVARICPTFPGAGSGCDARVSGQDLSNFSRCWQWVRRPCQWPGSVQLFQVLAVDATPVSVARICPTFPGAGSGCDAALGAPGDKSPAGGAVLLSDRGVGRTRRTADLLWCRTAAAGRRRQLRRGAALAADRQDDLRCGGCPLTDRQRQGGAPAAADRRDGLRCGGHA
jgi:hypothetical protein